MIPDTQEHDYIDMDILCDLLNQKKQTHEMSMTRHIPVTQEYD